MDKSTLKAWQILVETTFSTYLTKKYPGEMNTYMRFRNKVGAQCLYCKSSAKIMFKYEAVGNKEFLTRFKDNSWDGYF